MEEAYADTSSTLVSHGGALRDQLCVAVAGEYRLEEQLGSGGFGSVYRAVHLKTDQDVAIKVLRPQPAWSPQVAAAQVARFEREARLCAGLRHPNIVRLLDKGRTTEGLCYAVYELVPGESLRSLLLRQGQLSVGHAAMLMGQVLDALATAHAKGVVHRDLKPENIMVVSTGVSMHVKVLDFGIGTLTLEARDTAFNDLTGSQETIGTPRYGAPEQLRGDMPTTKSDLYAWGLVFLECITGRQVIDGSTIAEIYHQHLSPLEIPLPGPLVGHSLGTFMRRVLTKDPARRSGEAATLYHEFRELRLGDLVGKIEAGGPAAAGFEPTATVGFERRAEERHVTVMAFRLQLRPMAPEPVDAQILDPILRDQLSLCRDALMRYGATVTGELGDQLVAMFGYPSASDTDARRAVRTLLELAEDIRTRSARLSITHGLSLGFCIGVHTGPVTVLPGDPPTGITPTKAMALAANAALGTMVVSPTSRRLFEPYAELEVGEPVEVNGAPGPIASFLLVGERRIEAASFVSGTTGAIELIGRTTELAWLEAATISTETEGHAALVKGEAGIGKSRLVLELVRRAREREWAIEEFRCLSEKQNMALFPVLELLGRRLGLDHADSTRASERVVELFERHGLSPDPSVSVLCTWLLLPCPPGFTLPSMAPHRQRELLLDVLVTLLPRLGDSERSLMLVEDLHWADPTTLELFGRLLAVRGEARPALVCTARPQFEPPWHDVVLGELTVDRLSPEAAEQLVRAVWVGDRAPRAELVTAIIERADGVPLFVEELTRMVEQSGQSIDIDAIPITLRDSLAGRLDNVGEARAFAQIAAALGREFDREIVVASTDADPQRVLDGLERLDDAKLIYRRRRVGAATFVFRHALIREAAYASMPLELRRDTHAKIAAVLVEQFPDSIHASLAELARHYAGAGQYEQAASHGARAAQGSLDVSSMAEAIAQVRLVRAWLPELPDRDRVEVELVLNGIELQALMGSEGWASAKVRVLAERSRTLLVRSSSKEHTVSTLFGLFMHYHVAGERAACREVARELVTLADRLDDQSLQTVAATAEGVRYHAEGRFVDAKWWLDRACELYDPARDRQQGASLGLDCRVWASAQGALVAFGMGQTSRAFELAGRAIAWAREIGHVPSLGIALLYVSQIHQMRGDKPATLQTTGELLKAASTYGLPAFEGYAAAISSWATGDLAGVAAIIDILVSIDCNLILTYYGSYLADIEAEAGHIEAAIEHVETYLAMTHRLGEHVFEAELHRRRGVLEMRRERSDAELAIASLERARTLAREQGMSRFEAAAIRDAIDLFGPRPELGERLRELHEQRPDLHVEASN